MKRMFHVTEKGGVCLFPLPFLSLKKPIKSFFLDLPTHRILGQ